MNPGELEFWLWPPAVMSATDAAPPEPPSRALWLAVQSELLVLGGPLGLSFAAAHVALLNVTTSPSW